MARGIGWSSAGGSGRAMARPARAAHDGGMEHQVIQRRSLELLIRRAEAEERLLERRLDRMETEQRRTRRAIEAQLRARPWNRFVG
jgi:hypothetical protein